MDWSEIVLRSTKNRPFYLISLFPWAQLSSRSQMGSYLPPPLVFLTSVSQSSPLQQAAALSPKISCAECCHQLFCLTHSSVWLPSSKAKTSEDGVLCSQQGLFQHVWCSNHGISLGSTAERGRPKSSEDLLKHRPINFNLLANCNSQKKQRSDNRNFQCYNFKTDAEVLSTPTCESTPKQNYSWV